MNFIEAVYAINEGKKIRRKIWEEWANLGTLDGRVKCMSLNSEFDYYTWDIIANDWEIYEENQPQFYTFPEVIPAFNEGKSIYRAEIGEIFRKEELFYRNNKIFSYKDIFATDWIIKDEV